MFIMIQEVKGRHSATRRAICTVCHPVSLPFHAENAGTSYERLSHILDVPNMGV